ncbi:two-component regulator propeller domain-containing protein [Spirosoma luteum]|uniref:type IX secretion system anionic LPS delivery protein PorZ n=1 Tax=Spirosoma luteum TaxID=431553 RepID=UPI0003A70E75|nr:two-component regulator propeller domain-containing protein [Spirosoma luteum]
MMNCNQRSTIIRYRDRTLFLIGCLLFGIQTITFSQIGIWQTHASYQSGQSVAVVGTKIYAATQNGFFYYDKNTGETTTLSKADGLSDVGINRILYLADQKKILIAYQNGNLDFLAVTETGEPNGVTNVNTIVSATNLPELRRINHLNRINNTVYLSTAFGIVVLDIIKSEVRDTYLGRRLDGLPLFVFQTTATSDSLYALTGALQPSDYVSQLQAIRFAPNVNIADPANWKSITKPGSRTTTSVESIVTNQGRLSITVTGTGVYEQQNGQWVLTKPLLNTLIRQFPAASSPILATDKDVTLPGIGSFSGPLLANPREVVADGNTVWVADGKNGLLLGNAGAFQRIAPDGPSRDSFTGLYTYPQTLVTLAASRTDNTPVPLEYLSVLSGRWNRVDIVTAGFNSAAYLPTEQRLYLGSFGSGLWSQNEGQTPVAVMLPATIGPLITSLAADTDGNLWIATSQTNAQQATLHRRQADGQFKSFPAIGQVDIVQVVPDDNGFLWIRPRLGNGLIVFDPATNRVRYLTTQTGQGALPTNSVRSLAKDRNGAIWVGTDAGPTVFDNPYSAFDGTVDAQPPLLNRRRLLSNEVITAIVVDGGNRKWIGTRNGLYLVAPDGSQLLETFTAQNSPLPVNTIQALAIEPISGKLFIQTGTDTRAYGLVSYQGAATEPIEVLTGLTIFPNPVRPDFNGTVGIRGLTENSTVKILDAGGQLVYEARSQGGTATWNLIDYRGRQAQTGIYLVVVITADGTEGVRGKLAVVR